LFFSFSPYRRKYGEEIECSSAIAESAAPHKNMEADNHEIEEEVEEEVEDEVDDESFPDKIYLGGERQVIDMAFHPSQDVLGAGIIDGCVEVYFSSFPDAIATNCE
jgi:hypothetical protein